MSSSGRRGAATRAKDDFGVAKGAIDVVIPPALVSKFYGIAPCRIELSDGECEPGRGESIARRELKEEAPHPLAEDVGDDPEVAYQGFGALELLDMDYELADLRSVDETPVARLTAPRLNACDGRPRVERGTDLDSIK